MHITDRASILYCYPHPPLGLDKLFLFSYLLFYSHVLKNFTYYSFQAIHYFFFLPIILNYLMVDSGQNDLHTLHFYAMTKQ